MQPSPPSARAAWRRYAPLLAVVVVLAAVATGFAVAGGGDDDDGTVSARGTRAGTSTDLPVTYQEATAAGTVADFEWGDRCDPETGRLAVPLIGAAPCVPVFDGDNGGDTSQGVTADTIKVAYYVPKPDLQTDTLLKLAGAYDEPRVVAETLKAFVEIYGAMYETYGRRIELVPLRGTGLSADEAAARADAIRADEELGVFAVVGGPTQTKAFAEELAARGVLCIGSCLIAQPEQFYRDNSPYIWVTGPSPDQAAAHTVELVRKQLLGRPAEFAGDAALRDRERVFGLLTYDTPDGQYQPAWDNFKAQLDEAGIDLATHVTYFLDLAKAQEDARTIVTKLKNEGVTTVIFSGDPIMPSYFTKEATAQAFFPEWVMAGTVYADTNVFGRTFDQQQWAHAFGLSLIPTRTPERESPAVRLHRWWFGTEPVAENQNGIVQANVGVLMNGIHLAGPDLTPERFRDAMYRLPPTEQSPGGLRTVVTWGDHGFWPDEDVAGLDNATVVWWDPEAEGEDETGAAGTGMYRYIDAGRRYLPGDWPTEPMPFFERTRGAVTVYDATPPELEPPDYPPPPEAPTAE